MPTNLYPPTGCPKLCPLVSENEPSETVRKGSRIVSGASVFWLLEQETGLFDPFH
jgi:hypothetical protein